MTRTSTGSPSAYLYGITSGEGDVGALDGVAGGAPVRLAREAGLAAVVSDVPADFVEGRRRDMLAHARVLEAVAANGVVLPMRFGAVFDDDAAVTDFLRRRQERLHHLLRDFEGKVEMGVKAYYDEDLAVQALIDTDDQIRALAERARSSGHMQVRLELGRRIAGGLATRREADAGTILGTLEPLALDMVVSPPSLDLMIVNAALLADRTALGVLDEAVDGLGERWGGLVRIKYLGPNPPYSFASLDGAEETR